MITREANEAATDAIAQTHQKLVAAAVHLKTGEIAQEALDESAVENDQKTTDIARARPSEEKNEIVMAAAAKTVTRTGTEAARHPKVPEEAADEKEATIAIATANLRSNETRKLAAPSNPAHPPSLTRTTSSNKKSRI